MLLNLKNLPCIMSCLAIEIKTHKNAIYAAKSFYHYKNELG